MAHDYPNKTIILWQEGNLTEEAYKEIEKFNMLCHNNLIFGLYTISEEVCEYFNRHNIKWYYVIGVSTFYDLRSLYRLGASYVLITPPLTHSLAQVKFFEVPIRMIANVGVLTSIPKPDGVCGGWIRPEDVEAYDEYIDAIEFSNCDLKRERALYRIYAEDHNWPGDLRLLINDLNYKGVNRLINPEHSRGRLNCGQKCQQGFNCKLCYRMLDIADPELLERVVK